MSVIRGCLELIIQNPQYGRTHTLVFLENGEEESALTPEFLRRFDQVSEELPRRERVFLDEQVRPEDLY